MVKESVVEESIIKLLKISDMSLLREMIIGLKTVS